MDHPSHEKLELFLSGRLSPDEQSAMESHVAECSFCCEVLRGIPHGDLVERLRPVSLSQAETRTDQELYDHSSPANIPVELKDNERYEILERLGEGGMGEVFAARHRVMGRRVALKVIRQSLLQNPAAVERFQTEVRAAAKLSHRNIVTAFDAERAGDAHYLVMEYVEGKNMAAIVTDRGPLPLVHACNYAMQVASGLQHAHDRGMIHRDIKPHNLMLTPQGEVKVLDFGLARLAATEDEPDSGITREGATLGSPDYIAPEQARDSRLADARSDIYGLGCTLYYFLSGSTPFPEGSAVEKVIAHCNEEATAIGELREELPQEIVNIVERMMAKEPNDRFQTAADVVQALKPFAKRPAPEAPVDRGDTVVLQRSQEDTDPGFRTIPDENPLFSADLESAPLSHAAPVASLAPPSPRRGQIATQQIAKFAILGSGILLVLVAGSLFINGYFAGGEQSTTGWIDLIETAEPERDALNGVWEKTEDGLQVNSVPWARMPLRFAVPAEYDIEVEFTRHTGQDSIAIILARGSGQATLELDAWRSHLAGIQTIEERDLKDTANQSRSEITLVNGQRYRLAIAVRAGSISATLDGEPLVKVATDGSDLGLLPEWSLNRTGGLGIGAYESQTTFHQIRVHAR